MHQNKVFSVARAWRALRADLYQQSRAVLIGACAGAAVILIANVFAPESSAGSPSTDGASTSAPLQEAPASDDRAPIMFSPSIHTATMSPFGMRATPGTAPPMISGSRVISW